MKFVCQKDLLVEAVSNVSRAVCAKSPIPALEGILLKAQEGQLQLTGYDLELGIVTTIEAKTEQQGEFLFDSGVGRFFLVCHDRYVEAARACLPAEAEVMTTMDSDPADLLHVFLSTAEDAEHTITVVTGPAVYLPQLAPQAAGRFPRVYGVSREELMQALDEHFSFARFLLDNGSPMNEEQAMYSVASPAELPEIAGLLQRNRLLALARTGVEIYDASSCYVEPSVRVAPGARLLPGTMLRGKTVIGEEAVIGPWSVIDDSVIGARAVVNASQVRESRVGQDAVVGPYASVRGGCELGRSVRAGSFVELKNARLGENTQVPHLAYLGDTEAGANCNFGCGVTTANFDRVQKHETVVGEGAFIGCNTALIAPLQVGSGAYIGAGSTITEDVPAQALGIARARQSNKKEWAAKHKK